MMPALILTPQVALDMVNTRHFPGEKVSATNKWADVGTHVASDSERAEAKRRNAEKVMGQIADAIGCVKGTKKVDSHKSSGGGTSSQDEEWFQMQININQMRQQQQQIGLP